MTLYTTSLVVLAALIHASWNLLSKRAAAVGPVFVLINNLVACVAYAPLAIHTMAAGSTLWNLPAAGFVLLSGLLHLAYSLCLQRGYQKADFSVVYPIARGSGPVLASLGAIILLGEAFGFQTFLGLAAVIAGIGLIATQGELAAFAAPKSRVGLGWGSATGGLIASYTVVDAFAVRNFGIAPVALDWFSNVLRAVLLAPMLLVNHRRALAAMRGHWLEAVGVGLLSPLSYILVLAAINHGAPVSVVAPMREMSMMIGAIMGAAILRETVGAWRLGGCAILIAGVVLLSTSA